MGITLSSRSRKEQDQGPGRVFRVIESLTPSINEAGLGDRISGKLKTWSLHNVARKIVTGASALLSKFLNIFAS